MVAGYYLVTLVAIYLLRHLLGRAVDAFRMEPSPCISNGTFF